MVRGNSYGSAKILLGPLLNPGWLLNPTEGGEASGTKLSPLGFSTTSFFQNKLETILSEPMILFDL